MSEEGKYLRSELALRQGPDLGPLRDPDTICTPQIEAEALIAESLPRMKVNGSCIPGCPLDSKGVLWGE